MAAQGAAKQRLGSGSTGSPGSRIGGKGGEEGEGGQERQLYSFADLFNAIKIEDFSSYISKLSTPRELMLFMTELLARIEAHPDNQLSAQDMEIAVSKALEQAV